MIESPPARRRLIGAALRRYREENGYDLNEAARILACHRSKVSRIETGDRGIRPKELYELLGEYGVPQADQQALAAIVLAQHWTDSTDPDEDLPDAYREYLGLEQAAAEIISYDPLRIPDLARNHARLQPLPYARRSVTVLIGEIALRGPAAADLALLRALGKPASALTVRVVPMHATAISAPATLLRFASSSPLGAVYLPGPSGGMFLVTPDEVLTYRKAFDAVAAAALSKSASHRYLADLVRAAGQPAP